MNIGSLLIGNLIRYKVRTWLLLITIAIAFLIYGVLFSLLWFFNSGSALSNENRLITTSAVHFTQPIPLPYVDHIRRLENVKSASHSTWFGGYYRERRDALAVFAIEPETYLKQYPEIVITKSEQTKFLGTRNAVLVGATTARQYGWKPGDTIPLKSNIYRRTDGSDTWLVEIAALFSPENARGDSQSIYMHYDFFNDSLPFSKNMVGLVISSISDEADPDAVATAIDRQFANSSTETKTQNEKSFAKAFIAQIGNIVLIVQLVVGAAMITVLLVVANTMILNVLERQWEFGVLKTLGFRNKFLFVTTLVESGLLIFIGGVFGLLLAYFSILLVDGFVGDFLPGLALPAEVLGGGLAIMTAMTLIVGLVPAILVYRQDVTEALRKK